MRGSAPCSGICRSDGRRNSPSDRGSVPFIYCARVRRYPRPSPRRPLARQATRPLRGPRLPVTRGRPLSPPTPPALRCAERHPPRIPEGDKYSFTTSIRSPQAFVRRKHLFTASIRSPQAFVRRKDSFGNRALPSPQASLQPVPQNACPHKGRPPRHPEQGNAPFGADFRPESVTRVKNCTLQAKCNEMRQDARKRGKV